ncbi:uncharacterized protein LOC133198644 [Saccostrea echinata]|uniref:uncharacterized protein LOC133198644 n=1 Tax=Saccostrea echinata TaxID=191078 RepID=UPI002A7EBE5D|nr:uncharacterized protein LOC133198644 [Saccostrea echinata]
MNNINIFLLLFTFYLASSVLGQNYFGLDNTIGDVLGRRLSIGSDLSSSRSLSPSTQSLQNGLTGLQSTRNALSPIGSGRLWNYNPNRFSSWYSRFGRPYDDDSRERINRYSRRGSRRYLRNFRRRSNRFDSDESGERGNSWTNLYRSLNRRRRFGSDEDSDESGERRWGILGRYNRRRRIGSGSDERWGSGERRRGIFRRSYFGRRWGSDSDEDSGERFRSPFYRYRYRRFNRDSGERFRGRRFRYRRLFNRDDSDERDGLFRRFNRRNYRNIISRMNSPYSYNRRYFDYNPDRLSLFGNNWNRFRW